MSNPQSPEQDPAGVSREEMLSSLFAQMVMQQANMAMMLLGKVPHPQNGQTVQDIEGARMFIDQLEMLEVKTKGNLGKEEQNLLRQSLMSLRLAFVEAVESPKSNAEPAAEPARSAPAPESPQGKAAVDPVTTREEETKKKFSKKY
jgi:hypothetical protein